MLLVRKGSHRPKSAHILCGPCPVGHAGMAELVDAPDSKSGSGNRVGVRFPLPAPHPGDLMKFCSSCGGAVSYRVPKDDNRERAVCDDCGIVHYRNPLVVVGCVAERDGKVLMCRRAIEPRYGFWTLPAGFMENQETTMEAAARETWEEAEAKVKLHSLYTVINVPQIDQVHMYFLATLIDGKFGVGTESLECRLFEEDEIPWDDLAFPTVKRTLKLYFEDRQHGEFSTHVSDIFREPREPEFEVIRED